MSYNLFCKYKRDQYSDNQIVYESCCEEDIVQESENLPIDKIITAFSFWSWNNKDTCENFKGKGSFEIYTTLQFVYIYCYGMNGNDMNNFIDILLKMIAHYMIPKFQNDMI